jgi:hypothetical protein
MLKRACFCLLTLLSLMATVCPVSADPPQYAHPNADWLTWDLYDAAADEIDLSEHDDNTVYVFLFRPDNEASCASVRAASAYVREHSNHADRVLVMCCDDSGCRALKLFLRQEEYAKRVATWEADQAAAKLAAEQAQETWTPSPMPNFAEEIEDEMAMAQGLEDLCDYHLPFATCRRCNGLWDWLVERMAAPEGVPRILKINSQGQLLQEWTELPNNPNPLSGS